MAVQQRIIGGGLLLELLARFLARLAYVHVDFMNADDYVALAAKAGTEQRLIAYFATPAAVYGAICNGLAQSGLAARTRVVLAVEGRAAPVPPRSRDGFAFGALPGVADVAAALRVGTRSTSIPSSWASMTQREPASASWVASTRPLNAPGDVGKSLEPV